MIPKTIDTEAPILPLFAQRYSGVSYDPDRDVSTEQLLALIEAARWAPSCFGDQPWRFILCRKSTDPEGWEKAFACLMEGNQAWCLNAPVLALSCCDTKFARNDKPNRFGPYDTGAAAMSLCMQAAALGLMTHQMGGFHTDKACEVFEIPERYLPMAMMAIGYQLPEDRLPEQFRERELLPRKRNPREQHFFGSTWGKAVL